MAIIDEKCSMGESTNKPNESVHQVDSDSETGALNSREPVKPLASENSTLDQVESMTSKNSEDIAKSIGEAI